MTTVSEKAAYNSLAYFYFKTASFAIKKVISKIAVSRKASQK